METQSEAGRGESAGCNVKVGLQTEQHIWSVFLRELRLDEQRDICWRTRPETKSMEKELTVLGKHLQF